MLSAFLSKYTDDHNLSSSGQLPQSEDGVSFAKGHLKQAVCCQYTRLIQYTPQEVLVLELVWGLLCSGKHGKEVEALCALPLAEREALAENNSPRSCKPHLPAPARVKLACDALLKLILMSV